MLNIKSFVFNPVQVNAFVIWDQDTKDCILVDPGCWNESEQNKLAEFIDSNELNVTQIINTHEHFDHIWGNVFAVKTWGVPLSAHRDGELLMKNAENQARSFGLEMQTPPNLDSYLEEGDVIKIGNSELLVIHVPGHSPGSIVLYSEEDNFMICGDVLFRGSIGRTDLPMGNMKTLVDGIKDKLISKSDSTVVYPGHGPQTTIGEEKNSNPYLS